MQNKEITRRHNPMSNINNNEKLIEKLENHTTGEISKDYDTTYAGILYNSVEVYDDEIVFGNKGGGAEVALQRNAIMELSELPDSPYTIRIKMSNGDEWEVYMWDYEIITLPDKGKVISRAQLISEIKRSRKVLLATNHLGLSTYITFDEFSINDMSDEEYEEYEEYEVSLSAGDNSGILLLSGWTEITMDCKLKKQASFTVNYFGMPQTTASMIIYY